MAPSAIKDLTAGMKFVVIKYKKAVIVSHFKTVFYMALCLNTASGVAAAAIREAASINRAVLVMSAPSDLFDSGGLISTALIEDYKQGKAMKSEFDPNVLVPKNLVSGEAPGSIMNKVADTSVQYWWNNSGAKNSVIGRSVDRVEKTLSKEVVVKTTERSHKLNFTVQAFQSIAKVTYEGFGNAEMYYQMRDSVLGIQMREPIGSGNTKSITVGQTIKPNEQVSEIKFNLNW